MTEIRVVEPFDIGSPLPDGVTVLEASAGTGKTYTIAALATLYVAEGLPLDQMLLVSFTRLSTAPPSATWTRWWSWPPIPHGCGACRSSWASASASGPSVY